LALWTACIWIAYLPSGLASVGSDLAAMLPPSSGYSIHPWLLDFAVALLLAFAAHAHGVWILDRARLACEGAERLVIGTGLGFAGLVLAAATLGFLGVFRRDMLRLLMAVFFLTGLWQSHCWKWRPRFSLTKDRASLAPILLTLFFLGIALICAAAPETAYDALSWHLATARFFLQHGRFSFIELYRTNVPEYGEIFYGLGLAIHRGDLSGESAARMFNFLTLPGLLLAAAALAARIAPGPLPQALAALWVASSPVVMHRATTCYPDMGASLWGVLALLAFLQYHSTRRRAWVALCGLFAGLAAGSKFVGFYWIAIGGLFVTISALLHFLRLAMSHSLSDQRCQEARREIWRVVLTFAIVSGAICAPWVIRNWINTGDPFPPMLEKYLPNHRMDLAEAAHAITDAANRDRIPVSLQNYLSLPWRLTMEGDRWQGTIGPVFLLMAPFWLLGARKNRGWWWISAVLLVFSALWLKGPQWARYYLAAIPLLAGLGATGLCHPRLPRWIRAAALTVGLLLPLVNLPGLDDFWVSGGSYVLREIPWGVAIGSESEDTFRRRQIPDYDAALFLNKQAQLQGAILAVPGFHFFPQWLTRLRVLDVWENAQAVCFDSNRQREHCYQLDDSVLLRNMDDLHVQVLAIRRDQDWSAHHRALRLEDLFLRRYFRLLGYVGGTFLYARDLEGPEPDRVYVNADLTSRWAQRDHAGSSVAGGTVQLLPQGPLAEDGRFAVELFGESGVWFDVLLGDSPQLAFSVAQDMRYQQEDLSGSLTVMVDGRKLLEDFLSPQDFRDNWKELRVDLAEFAGRTVHLEIRLKPRDPGGRPSLAIADPVIYARETTEPLSEAGQRFFFNTATKRHPVAVRFVPEQVRPGESYQLEVPGLAGQFPALAGQYVDLLYSINGGPPIEAPRFRRLDARGRATVAVPRNFQPLTIDVRGVRRSGDALWLAAAGRIEVMRIEVIK
jgi:hypothetical protein